MDYLVRYQVEALMRYATPKERLILALAFYHGLRVSEVLELRMRDVEAGIVRIDSLKGSHKAKHAMIEIDGVSIRDMLATYMENRGPTNPDDQCKDGARIAHSRGA